MTLVAPQQALADDTPRWKKMRFSEKRGRIWVQTSLPSIIDRRAEKRLSTGFPTTVVVRAAVYLRGTETPVSFSVLTSRVVYDLWDESYRLYRRGIDGVVQRNLKTRDDVIRALTEIDGLPVANLDEIAVGPQYELLLTAELNPVSEELLAETRRWLSQPAGKGRLDATSSMFGSFVSVFVNPRLSEADRIVRYRSQPFYRVARKARP